MLVPVLRPLTLGETLDTSFGIYRALFASLFSVSLATQAIPLALSVYVEAAGGAGAHPGLQLSVFALAMLFGAVGTAATTFLVAETYLGGSLTTQYAFRRAMPFIVPLITASFLTVLIVALGAGVVAVIAGVTAVLLAQGGVAASPIVVGAGFVLAFVVAIGIFCALVVTTPAMVLEETRRARVAMGRSIALTRGHRLRIFLALLIVLLLLVLPTVALGGMVVAARQSEGGASALVALIVTSSVLQILLYPFFYVLLTVLYYDLRVRKEGYDLEMLATSLQQA